MLIEQRVLEYLQNELGMNDIYMEIPRDRPEMFVVLRVTDRGMSNRINEVTIELSSYAPSKYEAAALDELVRNSMDNIIELDDISCRFGGGNDNPDTEIKIPRYRCYFNLFY